MAKQLPNSKKQTSKKPASQTYVHRNQRVRVPDGYMAVGMITSSHGLNGEVKVEIHTDFPDRFTKGITLYLGEGLEEFTLATARPHQGQMLMVFEGISDRTASDELRGQWLFIPEDEAVELESDTYFVHDIVGLAVQTTDGRMLGTLTEVLFTGANDVYIVTPPDDPRREILIPAIGEVIKEVNLAEGLLLIEPIPGLLDE